MIVGGTGFGQVRDIASVAVSNQGYTVTLTQPWNVVPDATSQLQLVEQPERIVIYQNNQSGIGGVGGGRVAGNRQLRRNFTTAGRTSWSTTTRTPTSAAASTS